jgi:hypothetical protein
MIREIHMNTFIIGSLRTVPQMTLTLEVFMQRTTIVMVAALFLVLMPVLVFGQAADLSGSWAGDAALPGSAEKSRFILKLQKSEDSYSGTLADAKSPDATAILTDVRLERGVLKCKVTISSGGRDLKLRVALNSFYGRLIGGWATDEGAHAFAPLDFERSK